MLALMDKFATYFGLKLSVLVFNITEQMSIHCKKGHLKVEDGYYMVEMCIKALERLRTDQKFS